MGERDEGTDDRPVGPPGRAQISLLARAKVRNVCGLTDADFLPIRAGIVHELHYLQGRPDLAKRFETPLGAEIATKTDAYLKERGLLGACV